MGVRSSPRGVRPEKGGIQIDFRWRGRRWRPSLDLAPTPANLRYAERLRAEICDRIRLGSFRFQDYFPDAKCGPPESSATRSVRDYADSWVRAQGALERATQRGYQSSINAHIPAAWLDRPIASILHSEVAEWAGGDWPSAKTRNNALIPLRGLFAMALRDGAIDRDPTAGIKNRRHQAPPPDPFTIEEAAALVDELRRAHPREAGYFEVAFWTGMRTSELVELSWSDVDLRPGEARVARARVSGVLKGAKPVALA